jgi:hypothetical protein
MRNESDSRLWRNRIRRTADLQAGKLIEEKWDCVEAVAKALYRKKVLDGDRVREIIERIEERLRTFPPQIQAVLDR